MSKIASLFKGIQRVNETLTILDQFIDVDRLIGISNAQGPQAKLIKGILELNPDDPSIDQLVATLARRGSKSPNLPVRSKQKKLPKKTGT